MFCPKCGTQNVEGAKFCKNCGNILENIISQPIEVQQTNMEQPSSVQQMNMEQPSPVQQMNMEQPSPVQQSSASVNSSKNDKMFAYASIGFPAVGLLMFFWPGISLLSAVLLSSLGFSSAQKACASEKKLCTIGKVLSGILVGVGLLIGIVNLIDKLS